MQPSDLYLQNSVILITGSSRGLGKSLATNFAKFGATIIINYCHSTKEAQKTVQEITTLGGQAIAIKSDVSKLKEVQLMIRQILKKYHHLDILINNAGGVSQNWEKDISLNLTSCFNCLSTVGPIMQKQKHGKIVNISSLRSVLGATDIIAYSAAKAGVNNLTRSFAKVLAPTVNVNCIAPGRIDTNTNKTQNNIFNRSCHPLDIFHAAKFLSSPESDFITGQTLIIDGGTSL